MRDELASFKMYSSGGVGVEGPLKTEANGVGCVGGGSRRGRSGARDGDHGVCWRERPHRRGGHGGVNVWVYITYRRWERCYRRGAHERGYSIRRDRRGVGGGSHRTRVLCYRRDACKRGYSIRRDRSGVSGGRHRTRVLCYRCGACKRGYNIWRDRSEVSGGSHRTRVRYYGRGT